MATQASAVADVCLKGDRRALVDQISHTDTLVHCVAAGLPRSSVARYVFTVPSGTKARFIVLTIDSRAPPSIMGTATLNGGFAATIPPILYGARQMRTRDHLIVVATGAFLDSVSSATMVLDNHSGARTPLEIVRKDPSQLVARAPFAHGFAAGRLEVADHTGVVGAISLEPLLSNSLDSLMLAAPSILIRFQPGCADPPTGRTEAFIQDFNFSPTNLRDVLFSAGIERLERLFPHFKRSDVYSTNILGESIVLDDLSDIYIGHLMTGSERNQAVLALSGLPHILYAEPDSLAFAPLFVPNDPLYSLQWPLRNIGQSVCGFSGLTGWDIGATAAWDSLVPVAPTSIAILDTGIDPTHEEFYDTDFNTRLPVGATCMPFCTAGAEDDQPFDGCLGRHGTAVAGIAAATANNSTGGAGIAFLATPWPVKVLDNGGFAATSWVAAGIEYARAQNVPIINMSLGVPDAQTFRAVCLNAVLSGHLLVAAIGNDDDSLPNFPASYSKRVCTVGATFLDGTRWRDQDIIGSPLLASTFGSWIDLVAPGGRMVVAPAAGPDQYYDLTLFGQPCDQHPGELCAMGFSGTSSAAPVVSGVAALLKSQIPKLTGDDLTEIMKRTARDDLSGNGFDVFYGSGLVRADAALNYISFRRGRAVVHGRVGFQGDAGTLEVWDSTFIASRTFTNVPGLPFGSYACWRYRLRGVANFSYGFTGGPEMPWVRASGTRGWADVSPFDYSVEVPWGQRFGHWGAGGCTFETFVFRIPGSGGSGWWPTTPDSAVVAFTVVGASSLVGVDESGRQPRLAVRVYPSPGTRRITLDLELPMQGRVRATILDVLGRKIASVADGNYEAGAHQLHWDARGSDGRACSPGVYFYSVDYSGRAMVKRFILLGGRP